MALICRQCVIPGNKRVSGWEVEQALGEAWDLWEFHRWAEQVVEALGEVWDFGALEAVFLVLRSDP